MRIAALLLCALCFALPARALQLRPSTALLVADPRLQAVEVTVRKLRPPLALDVGSAGVRVRRAR